MKVVVFTAIMANDPSDKPIDNPTMFTLIPGWDYVLVTNVTSPVYNDSGWINGSIIHMEPPKEEMPDRNHKHWCIYANRWCKWHPDRLFPEYDYIIYVDGFQVPDVSKQYEWYGLIQYLSEQKKSIIQSVHNKQNCIYEEHRAIVACKKDTKEAIHKTTSYLIRMEFPKNTTLLWNGCYIYKAHSILIQKVWDDLWKDILLYTYRDQALLMYEIWKNNALEEWAMYHLHHMVSHVDSDHNHVYVD
jgi:hypothetical protein